MVLAGQYWQPSADSGFVRYPPANSMNGSMYLMHVKPFGGLTETVSMEGQLIYYPHYEDQDEYDYSAK